MYGHKRPYYQLHFCNEKQDVPADVKHRDNYFIVLVRMSDKSYAILERTK